MIFNYSIKFVVLIEY